MVNQRYSTATIEEESVTRIEAANETIGPAVIVEDESASPARVDEETIAPATVDDSVVPTPEE